MFELIRTDGKNYKTVIAKVYVFDVKTDKVEQEYNVSLNNKRNREKLEKTIMWALFNGKSIEIVNIKDERE